MNKIYSTIALAVMSLLLVMGVTSCVEDRGSYMGDGEEIEVNICAGLSEFTPQSVLRASAEESVENTVQNLYLMVFAKDGTLVHRDHEEVGEVLTPGTQRAFSKKPYLFTNATYTFVLIANYGEDLTIYGVEKTSLDNINSLSDLEAFKVSLQKESVQRIEPAFLMVGSLEAKVTSTGQIVIPLKRLDAKVRVVITTDNPTDGSKVSFTPKEWYIRNLPKHAMPYTTDPIVSLTGDANYYYPGIKAQDKGPLMLMEEGGKEFTFYLPPNSKKTRNNQVCPGFKKRELQEKSIDLTAPGNYHINQGDFQNHFVKNGDFVYADPYATYIEIVGDFKKERPDNSGISAEEMHYIIHLGYVNNQANNWEAESNASYTYNVKINGVGEVETEVVRDNEVNTGVTGNVLEYKRLEMKDSPFGYGVLTFTAAELSKLRDVSQMAYIVKTPFCDNLERVGRDFNTPKPAGLDNDWIRFRFHPTVNQNANILPYDKNNKGLTLEQFLKKLPDYKSTGATVTYYIDEYYYKTKPSNVTFSGNWEEDGWRTFVNQPDRYIGLFIFNNTDSGHKISRDQESQYTKADILFRQEAIVTHYSLKESVLARGESAFGIQAMQQPYSYYTFNQSTMAAGAYVKVQEQGSVANGANAYYETLFNRVAKGGYQNMAYNTLLQPARDGYEVITNNLDNSYKEHKAYLECLKYNRDENGNGVIDREEMVWYLPALYQYISLGIGLFSLPNDNPLYLDRYPYDDFRHFVTSTRAGQQRNNSMTYYGELLYNATEALYDPVSWPLHGFGTGDQVQEFWKYVDYVQPYIKAGKYAQGNMYYRCARKLGKAVINAKIEPETPMFSSVDVGNSYKITCNLEEKSVRPSSMKVTRGPLPKHNERSIFNRPTRTFYVWKETISNDRAYNGTYRNLGFTPYNQGEAACQTLGPEWRLPSVAELAIMLMALDEQDPPYQVNRNLPAAYGWEIFTYGIRRYNRQELTATNALGDQTSKKVYWSSTRFSSNREPDRYVFGMIAGYNHPVPSLVRPHVRPNMGGRFAAKGYVRCVHDGD